MTSVLLALAGLVDEPELVRAAPTVGLTVARRCVDAVDLLAAAANDAAAAVVVASGLPRLSPDLLARLGERTIIGVAADSLGRERLNRLGIDPVIDVAPSAQTTMQQVADICRARTPVARPSVEEPSESIADPTPISEPESTPSPARASVPTRAGMLMAVWGPAGAPGRTTIALGLAEALAHQGHRVALVDADTYAPSISVGLGLVEPASGLIAACRQAEAGTLTPAGLAGLTMPVGLPTDTARVTGARAKGARVKGARAKGVRVAGQWCVLGGIDRPSRWTDLRPGALDRLWSVARSAFDVIVVDVGFCLEVDPAPGAWARQRNAAALSAIATADQLVAVADGSSLGAMRLIVAWSDLGDESVRPPTTIVCNRADRRMGAWRAAIEDGIGPARMYAVPDEPRVVRTAWERGLGLGERSRGSRVLRALDGLAADLMVGGRVPRVPVSAA